MILKVPASLKLTAMRDPENFIRDIACFTQRGTRPFIRRKKRILQAVKHYTNPFNPHKLTFDKNFVCKDRFRRFMHIDLGHTKDSVGIAMGHVPTFVDREEVIEPGPDSNPLKLSVHRVKVPLVKIDFWGKISVRRGEEIILSEMREIVYSLSRRGFYFGIISFDRFQSIDSVQILRSYGYTVGHLSIDRTANIMKIDREKENNYAKISTEGNRNTAQQAVKDLLYDERLWLPAHNPKYYEKNWAAKELELAQEDQKSGKIDHPPGLTIDVEQALAGVAIHCVTNEKMLNISASEAQDLEVADDYYKNRQDKIDDRIINNDSYDYSESTDPRDLSNNDYY